MSQWIEKYIGTQGVKRKFHYRMIKITGNEYLLISMNIVIDQSWSNALIAQGDHKIYSPERNNCKNKPSKQTNEQKPKTPGYVFLLKRDI